MILFCFEQMINLKNFSQATDITYFQMYKNETSKELQDRKLVT